jgi:hypothetical protein
LIWAPKVPIDADTTKNDQAGVKPAKAGAGACGWALNEFDRLGEFTFWPLVVVWFR